MRTLGQYRSRSFKIEPYILPDLGEFTVTRTDETKVALHGKVKYESLKAILFIIDKERHEVDEQVSRDPYTNGVWFPFSQVKEIHKGSVLGDGIGNDKIVVTGWIAKQKGIEV
jgi:hypothetical protein